MYSQEAVERLQRYHGGSAKNLRSRPKVWRWKVSDSKEIVRILGAWLPMLSAKRRAAAILLEYLRNKPEFKRFQPRSAEGHRLLKKARRGLGLP